VVRGDAALTAIVTAIALTVLREGSETVLFLIGIASSPGTTRAALGIGSLLGLAAGGAAGGCFMLASASAGEPAVRGDRLADPAARRRNGRAVCPGS